MIPKTVRHPLEFYVAKIEAGEPFCSLLYGDGEFRVALGENNGGKPWTEAAEVITPSLIAETFASMAVEFHDDGGPVIRATDLNLIHYRDYQGGDGIGFKALGKKIEPLLQQFPDIVWADGTVWETAAQEGKLGPLIHALQQRETVLVANRTIIDTMRPILEPAHEVRVPKSNAGAFIDETETSIAGVLDKDGLCIYCSGLSTVGLIIRLRRRFPNATLLDLGSTFDVFAKAGAERGWRGELYQDQEAWRALCQRNLQTEDRRQ